MRAIFCEESWKRIVAVTCIGEIAGTSEKDQTIPRKFRSLMWTSRGI